MGRRFRFVLPACAAVILAGASTDASAQCGVSTSCRQCHEVEGKAPPDAASRWHADHSFGDLCPSCHGGDPSSNEQSIAHGTLGDPLAGEGKRCAACHAPSAGLVAAYAELRAGPAPPSRRAESGPPPEAPRTRPSRTRRNRVGASFATALAVAFAGLVAGDRRRRGERRPRRSAEPREGSRDVRPALVRETWSPYVAGGALGVVVAASLGVFGHRLSGGGAYQQIASAIGRVAFPSAMYFRHVVPAGAEWELACVAGALLGAFAAARASGSFRIRTMPDSGWVETFGPSVARRFAVGFLGAALAEFAAGIAGGCTASLAVSGGAALSPGAFLFMAGMFAGGIPVAWLVRRSRRAP
ncbi:MAG TPA: YeeE/YedE thiosulfate transporter family protein [Polyangiaceae bacterium]|nr:YeeE/YedE thiosulfate transporter family protein [Polyangiaceae bacterium]